MASAAASPSKKTKCKFWDKCFRKNAAHLKQFLHPNDVKDEDEDEDKKDEDNSKESGAAAKTTPVQTTASGEAKTNKKRGAVHDVSDSEEDEDVEMRDDGKPIGKKRKSDDEDDAESPSKKSKTEGDKGTNDSKPGPTARSPRRLRCMYGKECYQKNPAHLKEFSHPGDPGVSDDDDDDDDDDDVIKTRARTVKPLHEMKDGQTVDFATGDKIKRDGNHYTCSCNGWKMQKNSPEKRTCKHLKDYLGDAFEKDRTKEDKPKMPKGYIKQHIQVSVLLAQKYDDKKDDPKGWWISEKLDGVRAFWNGRCFYSRLGNAFYAPEWFTKNLPTDMHLDGELFGGRGRFQSTVKIVKNKECDDWKKIKYFVFDAPHIGNQPFEQRMQTLKEYFDNEKPPYGKLVEHSKCTGKEQLQTELDKVLKMGGEGLMIRKPKSVYEKTRSYTLLKIKKFHDAEAVVIAHEPGKGRNSNVTGALRCRMECGKEFSVGSGLCDKDRRNPPKIGSIITYKFQELSDSGSPRFPVFLGIRIDMDGPKDAVLPKKIRDDV